MLLLLPPPLLLLQLIRKPDRDWNLPEDWIQRVSNYRYNSLENPIGIETRDLPDDVRGHVLGYNSLENPIGIETHTPGVQSNQQSQLQLIRKPDRDWNLLMRGRAWAATELQLIRKPDRDWNCLQDISLICPWSRYNSLENPIGIETISPLP